MGSLSRQSRDFNTFAVTNRVLLKTFQGWPYTDFQTAFIISTAYLVFVFVDDFVFLTVLLPTSFDEDGDDAFAPFRFLLLLSEASVAAAAAVAVVVVVPRRLVGAILLLLIVNASLIEICNNNSSTGSRQHSCCFIEGMDY